MTSNRTTLTNQSCNVSIIIKALNEENNIVAAIESALRAIQTVGGEVILADSCSTDRTVELASRFPIQIFQLANPDERCCGIGPQLGYQHSLGEFIYILDGDMQMLDGFLTQALDFMRKNADVVGVGGRVVEINTKSLEYIARMERTSGHMQIGEVDRLDMGGLYRRSAIEKIGYLSNCNLHSYEEFDLAIRLRAHGGELRRIAIDSVRHRGHDTPPYQLLIRRWRSRYIFGVGELVRAAWGKSYFKAVILNLRELKIYTLVLTWWIAIPVIVWFASKEEFGGLIIASFLIAPILAISIRKKSVEKGIFSVISWFFCTAGLLKGLSAKQKSTNKQIKSIKIK